MYGAGYTYQVSHAKAYEGAWKADPTDGSIEWLEDCHGDTYSVFATRHVVYTASHAHSCANVGGWPEQSRRVQRHLMAWTRSATGTLAHNSEQPESYSDFGGVSAPSMFSYFPAFAPGSYTGANQAVWHITGNSRYLVAGGEFVRVNGRTQQGLTRFAVRGTAGNPSATGPQLTGAAMRPTLTATTNSVRASVPINNDPDDLLLTYRVYRNGRQIRSARFPIPWWNRTPAVLDDEGLASKRTYTYWVTVTDPHGHKVIGAQASVTTK